jgi:hypothetical protein
MGFESLSERYEFTIANYPEEWLPLTHLYDPDLPLFPLQYFHFLDPSLPAGHRPGERDRLFGFVHHVNYSNNALTVCVAISKDLSIAHNARYRAPLEDVVKDRLGIRDAITLADIKGSLQGVLSHANKLVEELWYRVVDGSFGKSLPFGRLFDGLFGLVRFIASWNSDGGRKGELIQAHFFLSEFGSRIATGGGIHVDFYLLPTFEEFTDASNPLSLFPRFAELMRAADTFVARYCTSTKVGKAEFSAFHMKKTGVGTKLRTETVLQIINAFHGGERKALFDNYSAFNRGPPRSIIALMMFADLRNSRWHPALLTQTECAAMYPALAGTYQTPKVIQLYAQLCFGSQYCLPIDNWVETFLQWPLWYRPTSTYYKDLFAACDRWGKIERLIWLASQARKVHSSVCANILWCVRFGGPEKAMRGANPLACKICEDHIRLACPAYAQIKLSPVFFNATKTPLGYFNVKTSAGDNSTAAQVFISCQGTGSWDEYSPRDRPERFASFPISGHVGTTMSVEDFIKRY